MPGRPAGGERAKGSGVSVRLSVKNPQGRSASSAAPAHNKMSKKRRFEAPTITQPSNPAQVADLQLLHQKSELSFHLYRPPNSSLSEATWYAKAKTCLYVLQDEGTSKNKPATENKTKFDAALHLRGSCHVSSVEVETPSTMALTAPGQSQSKLELVKRKTKFHHFDPLERVLLKPAKSYTMDDVIQRTKTKRHEADSQSTRGATGMTTAIRAASIGSNLGELRILAKRTAENDEKDKGSPSSSEIENARKECWKLDIESSLSSGDVSSRLVERMKPRTSLRKDSRIGSIATLMAKNHNRAAKVTVCYEIYLGGKDRDGNVRHLGGIHALTTNKTPHVYTTCGAYGDHEGPRSWIPTTDSASSRHRATHDMTILVTAPMNDGLSVVGFGEDFGVQETLLHDGLVVHPGTGQTVVDMNRFKKEVGNDHVQWLCSTSTSCLEGNTDEDITTNAPHVIPPEILPIGPKNANMTSVTSIFATSVWKSSSWLPISPRSQGFAIGPFRIIEDPEYLNSLVEGETGDASSDEEDDEDKRKESPDPIQDARENGEGIRQAYFAPIFARKFIHATTSNVSLLPDTKFDLTPLSKRQMEILENLDKSVLTSTVGVPHRALSLMRDVLALPAFRTVSYTQIWIPDAVHGGVTSGSLHCCPEVMNNPFLGGAIIDSRLLPPINHRLPYYHGGRILQFLQARCAIRGWIMSAIPLGGRDDVGNGYIHTLIESLIMSLYARGHGAHGEGGGKGGVFFTKRFASRSGLNSSNLDFLPVQNIEDVDFDDGIVGGIVGAVPVEDRNNDQLWRSASNGTESHTSAMDEFAVRQLLTLDTVSALERGTDVDIDVPKPSVGWMGSHLSLSYLSSNANSSSALGCGALELQHPIGGLTYRALKGDLVRRVVEGRAGVANFIRLVRATFVAAHLADTGRHEIKYPPERKSKGSEQDKGQVGDKDKEKDTIERPKPRFIVCVNEILKKRGLSHTLFARALQTLSGRVREQQLVGRMVDVERSSVDPRTSRPFVDPEGFPNSYVRGASQMYLRVGVHVEPSKDVSGVSKGIQLQAYAEPVIPIGGISYGGPITLRVVENEGQFREWVKDLNFDGSRRDWGSITLHAKPVTLPKAQTAASGIIESASAGAKQSNDSNKGDASSSSKSPLGITFSANGAFTESSIHKMGYQAIELIRITNLTPLLWVRVDPMLLYGGKISVIQQDACLAEMLFHDGDAGAQVDALRALAERPMKIQGSVKVSSVFDVQVSELPVRVLGDCLRGTPALHSSLPHTPSVRAQAAFAIAQWQNNKAPKHKNDIGQANWVGLHLLIQYFRERFYNNETVMPVKFNRIAVKKNHVEPSQTVNNADGSTPSLKANEDDGYQYLDDFDEGVERVAVLEEADEVEVEEDEEYRVRSAVITAIASVRAKDGLTPSPVLQFLETVLKSVDAEMIGNLVTPDEEVLIERKCRRVNEDMIEVEDEDSEDEVEDVVITSMPYASNMLIADTLLALCHINVSPSFITDPTTGKSVQSTARHPVSNLIEISRRWLEWELYRENVRKDFESKSLAGVSGVCYDTIAPCAITALYTLSILRQSTTDITTVQYINSQEGETKERFENLDEVATASFYISVFDSKPTRSDVTRAACAQAVACVCCAADRFETEKKDPVGLLTALEFMFERIIDPHTSPGLRQTLAQLMLDACSGKICSMQRVAAIGGRNDLVTSAARFLHGPLGASYGGDTGAAAVTNVNDISYSAASAVNDGARRGLAVLRRAGHPRKIVVGEELIVRIARFATSLWRTINGEPIEITDTTPGLHKGNVGVCATDGQLRCTLLALWQWVWKSGCFAVMQVQIRKPNEWSGNYKDLGVDKVMKTSEEEKEAADEEKTSLAALDELTNKELDRQEWRGQMAVKAYETFKLTNKLSTVSDLSATEQGIGQSLPPIKRDTAFKQGGWIASAAQQRRTTGIDGGTAITKIRLRTSNDQ
mmetsp:Transcript_24417/g.67496  ORF Transcript_24417/g.67496 Transcript_24417/m.67496 type:complete len:1959 (-) Transcript_24417:791-6667(-)|eukprot:CAMPEP_0172362564 /NCGR_PEP_ID=MMETSP1060-20121228/6157_1 /TAXON_ID=37318 /ORGANISM="Pseudo-nitzschia pungens, Strain cf. cingulata" /LENGTH=1958 /DNA_ID=CAMNT_0013085103 /DNA_START=120 /DNA_END=5996 /DNA_ORIENTATION=+